jgi:hypothetical protein
MVKIYRRYMLVRFEVLTAVLMKIKLSWDITPA